VVSVSGLITYFVLNQSSSSRTVSFKAAIVDQLSGTFPNPSFNDNAKTILVGAGYTVDYFSPDQVTVDFFRSLPSKGYGLVIMRAHSTGERPGDPVAIITSEPYSRSRYVYEQVTGAVGDAFLSDQNFGYLNYFDITPLFVRSSMQGEFPNTIFIMMGCTGLKNSEMAQALLVRGARVYISWDKSVTADRTDNATTGLLRSLSEGKTVQQAVSAAMGEAGPDPIYNSQLGYYPEGQGGLVLSPSHTGMMPSVQTAEARPVQLSLPE
jgi:hypothetical protein